MNIPFSKNIETSSGLTDTPSEISLKLMLWRIQNLLSQPEEALKVECPRESATSLSLHCISWSKKKVFSFFHPLLIISLIFYIILVLIWKENQWINIRNPYIKKSYVYIQRNPLMASCRKQVITEFVNFGTITSFFFLSICCSTSICLEGLL